jgi:hypothetical protein
MLILNNSCTRKHVQWHLHDQQYNLNRWFHDVTGPPGEGISWNNDIDNDGTYDIAEIVLPQQSSCTNLVISVRGML